MSEVVLDGAADLTINAGPIAKLSTAHLGEKLIHCTGSSLLAGVSIHYGIGDEGKVLISGEKRQGGIVFLVIASRTTTSIVDVKGGIGHERALYWSRAELPNGKFH